MCLLSPAGAVFTNRGKLVLFDELSSTFSKLRVDQSNGEGKEANAEE